jgi:hypothetical protein
VQGDGTWAPWARFQQLAEEHERECPRAAERWRTYEMFGDLFDLPVVENVVELDGRRPPPEAPESQVPLLDGQPWLRSLMRQPEGSK